MGVRRKKMAKEQKRKLLAMAPECLERAEKEVIREGLRTGKISDELLKKMIPKAYPGVLKEGLLEYFLGPHNRLLMGQKKINQKIRDLCMVHPGLVVWRKESKTGKKGWIVRTVDGKNLEVDNIVHGMKTIPDNKLFMGTPVLVHQGKVNLLLTEEEFKRAKKLFERGKKSLKT